MSIDTEVLAKYLDAQQELIAVEAIDTRTAVISLPLHFSSYSRVEISVTQVTPDQFVLSDMAQTIGELNDAGYHVKDKLRERITEMVKIQRVRLSGNTLVRDCTAKELGNAIHDFAEAAKTIGDAYLVYPARRSSAKIENDLKELVRQTFQRKQYTYKERETVHGEVEQHKVDFFIHPNGAQGLAIAVLPDPDRLHAEAWGFKTQDIKNRNKDRILVGVVYDDKKAKEVSRNILDKMADLSIPSSAFDLDQQLDTLNISHGL